MSSLLILIAAVIMVLAALCHTPSGLVSPGAGLILKVSAMQGRELASYDNIMDRRAANLKDIRIIDGRPNPRDGVIREDISLNLPGRSLAARLYYPGRKVPLNILISYHGGGFVVGSLDTNERLARDFCRHTGSLVLAVAYRKAPEYVFPAAHEDAMDTFLWVRQAQLSGKLPNVPVWVAGDSAGANLAASVCLMARYKGLPQPGGQLLFYPVANVASMDTVSYRLFGKGYLLTKAEMEWFTDQYLPNTAQRSDPRISLLLEPDLSGLAPALVLTAGKDVLRDEGEAYAARLRDSGCAVKLYRFSGLVHGFAQMRHFCPTAWRLPKLAGRFMKEHSAGLLS